MPPLGKNLMKLAFLRLVKRLSYALLMALFVTAPSFAVDTLTFIHTDVAGSPVAATDQNGAVIWREDYRPYGERIRNAAAAAGNRQLFHGKAADPDTGLSYFGARYYDPVVGRFMGVDPRHFTEENLQSFNRYAYGNNNPYRFIDLDGNVGQLILGIIVFAYTAYELHPMSMPVVPFNSGAAVPTVGPGEVVGAATAVRGVVRRFATKTAGESAGKTADAFGDAVSGETKYTAAGRQAHRAEPLPEGFERNVGVPNTRLRMDGYNRESREIIEIKPNNPRAIARGERQLQQYCAACDTNIGPGHTSRPVQTYDPKKYLD